jgi:hypothetical protein
MVVLNNTSSGIARTFVHNINIESCLAKSLANAEYHLPRCRIARTPHHKPQLVATDRQLVQAHDSPADSVDSGEPSDVLVDGGEDFVLEDCGGGQAHSPIERHTSSMHGWPFRG